jgi:UDP-4-amino-4,6-dideoxy-N-acetyl-beta-L-altrosamine N-acetyltransferase
MLVGSFTRLRILDSGDASYLRQLRNHPQTVAQYQSRHFISDVAQDSFVRSLATSHEHLYFIAESISDQKPFGCLFIRNIDHRNQRGENGIFLDPDRGTTGVETLEAASLLLRYEFEYLNLHKILGEVIATNRVGIRFNEMLGFQQDGVRRRHVFVDGRFEDLIQFALFRDEFYGNPTSAMRRFLATSGAS